MDVARAHETCVAADSIPAWVYPAALVVVAAASRLPQLLSPNLLLDGDECYLGLMAKHLAALKEFPIFFYGQHYGFALVEAAAGAVAFRLFGVGPVALKTAMLALWTAGVLFLFLAQSTLFGRRAAFWITLALLLNPAWAVFSMKARGGYVTAFAGTAVLFWLLARARQRDTIAQWMIVGLLVAIVFVAQPLWIPGVLPIVLGVLASRRRLLPAISCVAAAAAAVFLVRLAPATTPDQWGGPAIGNSDLLGSLPWLGRQIYISLTGSYYLTSVVDPPGPATKMLAVLGCCVLVLALLIQVYRVATKRYCPVSHLLFVSACSTLIAEWLLLRSRDGRYLLPLSTLLVLLAGAEIVDLVGRRLVRKPAATTIAAVVLGLGAVSMVEFRGFNFLWKNPPNALSETRRLQTVISYLKVEDATHVFSMNGLLDPQLVFYSDEQVLARWTYWSGRYPPYLQEVNRALAGGERVAVVGYTDTSGAPGCWDVPICTGGIEQLVPNPENMFKVDGKYFVYVGANRQLLEKLHFYLPE